ncbi:MAG: hypothetical protein NTV34_05880 [Proteobacteria bacterium]|nr:hypothetical protein [Pseudomonadota bacterium]
MMKDFQYWPYDEVELSMLPEGSCVYVKTPWVKATVNIPEGDALIQASDLVKKFLANTITPLDLPLVSDFFEKLSEYPLAYVLPMNRISKGSDSSPRDKHTILPGVLDQKSPVDLLRQISGTAIPSFSSYRWSGSEIDFCDLDLPPWDWDHDSALAFSTTSEKLIDPISLHSVVRRFHYIDVVAHDDGSAIFAKAANLEQAKFRHLAGILVRQNHYVTLHCQESLIPAVSLAMHATPLVKSFIDQERGHDLILDAALKSMNLVAGDIPVSNITQMLMGLLHFAPIATLLESAGFSKAAKQVNRHMEINEAGSHHNVARGFLIEMQPCEREYAIEAMHIAELVTVIMNRVTKSAWQLALK